MARTTTRLFMLTYSAASPIEKYRGTSPWDVRLVFDMVFKCDLLFLTTPSNRCAFLAPRTVNFGCSFQRRFCIRLEGAAGGSARRRLSP